MIRTWVNNRNKFYSLGGFVLLLLLACNHKSPNTDPPFLSPYNKSRIDSTRKLIKSGDIILRNGTDEVSRAARSFNRIDTTFSHCGIVLVENDTPFVYHALGGEYNPSQKLRRDPLDSFWLPPVADKFAIYRYNFTPSQYNSLQTLVHNYYAAGLPFDMYFNFLTDDKMYCSEFVFKCVDSSLSGGLRQFIKAREWPYGVSPDDLYLNPYCHLVKRVDY